MSASMRWLVWLAYSSLWTIALVSPIPVESLGGVGAVDFKFLAAKTLHVTAYAVLAILTGWLCVPSRYRWLLMFLLATHAAGTEFVQQFVETRTGCLSDVLFDLAGIGLGTLVTWKWWSDPV